MVWVLGNHKKFNTAWCLIRDLHRSSMDVRWAMLVMIDRYTAAYDPSNTIQTFQIMERFRMTPDLKVFHALLTALCKNRNIEEVEEFVLLNKKFFPLETKGFNIILNSWCSISVDVFEAKRIWREMSKCCLVPDATSYTQMISCFSKVGNLFDSLRLYDEMKQYEIVPDSACYTVLVEGLATCGLLVKAREYYAEMRLSGAKLLKEPVRHLIHQREKAEPLRVMRNAMKGAWVRRGRSSVMRRKKGGKWRRKATTVT